MTKEFTFQEALWHCSTIYLNKRILFSQAVIVQSPGNKLFTCACLPVNQYRRICIGYLINMSKDLLHPLGTSNNTSLWPFGLSQNTAQSPILFFNSSEMDNLTD